MDTPHKINVPDGNITIIAKRWFDKVNGNTYHSVRVLEDGFEIGFIPFEYGYDNAYVQTALKIMQKNGYFDSGLSRNNGSSLDYSDWHDWRCENPKKLNIYCNDVNRKKDLV